MVATDKITTVNNAKIKIASVTFLCIVAGLILRLWYLQVVKGDYFKEQSESNRFKQVYIPPARGEILDRNGRILVANRPAFNIELVREECPDIKATVSKLATIVDIDVQKLLEAVSNKPIKRRAFEPRILIADADRDLVARVAANRHALPGIVINAAPARVYANGDLAAHLLGYIREINNKQLESSNYSGYRSGDLVGQMGVELLEEYLLFGKRGVQNVIVNAVGTRIQEIYSEQDLPGHTVMLTIDYAAQKAAEEVMHNKKGALIALNPNTGEVLAMVSRPSFDPNIFATKVPDEQWKQLNSATEKRFSNRAISGEYHPGSVFKVFTAVAALAEGIITPQTKFTCTGSFSIGKSRAFRCMKRAGHGSLNLYEALKLSCNVYFYQIGQQLGVDRIHEYATRFGFGSKTELGIEGERAGLVPSTAWKKTTFKKPEDQKWYPGETPSVSIGQGSLVVTPIQVATAISALVNGGKLYKPAVIKRISGQNQPFEERFQARITGTLGVEQWVLTEVKNGLIKVVNEQGGTAYNRGRLDDGLGVQMGGKTGTAQTRVLAQSNQSSELGWFAGFAPLEHPEIVVAVVIEGEGGGGVAAAPVAKAVVEAYLGTARFKDDAVTDVANQNSTSLGL